MTNGISASSSRDDDDGVEIAVTESIVREMEDAFVLMDHAVGTGYVRTATNETLSEDIVTTLKTIGARAGITKSPPSSASPTAVPSDTRIKASEWAQFELAYYKLARFMSPVNAQTLRNTEEFGKAVFGFRAAAQRFTKLLWFTTIMYAIFIVAGEWGLNRYAPVQEGEVDLPNTLMQFVQILIPYAYGGLGACAYLLRSAHVHIYERSFDTRRQAEYWNRIVLGTVSGGAIILFVNYVTDADGTTIKLSSAALGFIGGYSTDFLFNAIERIVSALLPKLGVQTIRRDTADVKPPLDVTSGGLTLKELVERFEKAGGADKALYKGLIEKLRDRL